MTKARQVEAMREASRHAATLVTKPRPYVPQGETIDVREARIRGYLSSPTASGAIGYDDVRFLIGLLDSERRKAKR